MKSISIIILFLVSYYLNIISAPDNYKDLNTTKNTSISGKIIDKYNNESLPGVCIELANSGEKVYSDFEGNFKFTNLKPGIYSVVATFISYREISTQIIVNINGNNYHILKLEQDIP